MMVACSVRALLLFAGTVPVRANDYNILNLDNATMEMLMGKELPAFVRFEKEYPNGEKHEAFRALATNSAGADVIIGNVEVGLYDEKRNQDLAERYSYKRRGKDLDYTDMDNLFPRFRYFPANGGEDFDYTDVVTVDAITLFLKTHANVYFGMKGTLRNFDQYAAEFVRGDDSGKVATLATARGESSIAPDANMDAARHYVRIMERTQEKGADWPQKEYDRLKEIINGGKMSRDKRADLQLKMNRLSSFITPYDGF
mmetsp:Transcript_14571/g.41636  ORF Transcript_14571/g.41636 Transcript_14571/m.41636 type:complete len:256 (+) Transcript_14571:96-863(+)